MRLVSYIYESGKLTVKDHFSGFYKMGRMNFLSISKGYEVPENVTDNHTEFSFKNVNIVIQKSKALQVTFQTFILIWT